MFLSFMQLNLKHTHLHRTAQARVAATMPKRKRARSSAGRLDQLLASSECGTDDPGACHCTAPKHAVDAALKRTLEARAYGSASTPARGPLNDEAILRAIIHDFLAHSRAPERVAAKQVRLREALRRVAAKLSAVPGPASVIACFNTKTTPFRTLLRALWDGCEMPEPCQPKSFPPSRAAVIAGDVSAVDAALEQLRSKADHGALAPPPMSLSLPRGAALDAARRTLERDGIVLLPRVVSATMCRYLLQQAGQHAQRGRAPTRLTESMALGRRGAFFSHHWPQSELRLISDFLAAAMNLVPAGPSDGVEVLSAGAKAKANTRQESERRLPVSNTKNVLLVYAQGGENWAHQDDNRDFPFQALLMLSVPGRDFTGGSLYTVDVSEKCTKRQASFGHAGDIVVFRSNRSFFHGMDPVCSGSSGAENCCRIAVGLLHRHKSY